MVGKIRDWQPTLAHYKELVAIEGPRVTALSLINAFFLDVNLRTCPHDSPPGRNVHFVPKDTMVFLTDRLKRFKHTLVEVRAVAYLEPGFQIEVEKQELFYHFRGTVFRSYVPLTALYHLHWQSAE